MRANAGMLQQFGEIRPNRAPIPGTEHGEDAALEAAQLADAMLGRGDMDGYMPMFRRAAGSVPPCVVVRGWH